MDFSGNGNFAWQRASSFVQIVRNTLCYVVGFFFFWYMVDTIENLLEFKISFRSCVGVVIIGGCF